MESDSDSYSVEITVPNHRLYIRYPGYETLARTPMVAVHSKIPIRVVNYFYALYVFVGRYDYTTDSTSLFVCLKVS